MTGQIVRLFEERGFAFVQPDEGGKEIFLHVQPIGQNDLVGCQFAAHASAV